MKRKLCACVLGCLAIIAFVGCGASSKASGSSDSTKTGKKDTITFGALAEPSTLDPSATNDSVAQFPQYQIYDTLVREEKDGSLVPALAEDWDIEEGGKVVVFHLRDGVKFHNGDVMTADDVIFSINRAIASSFTKKVTGTMQKAEKVDDKTVRLTLKYPYGAIIGCMSSANLSIVNKKFVESDPQGWARHPIGTGPYQFEEWKSGEKLSFTSFPNYYRGEAAIKHMVMKIITDATTAVVALEKGETDIMDTPPKTARQSLIDNKDIGYYEADQACYYLIAFNNKKGRFSDKRLREAVSYAVDRDEIILGACEGIGRPVEAAMVPSCAEYPEDFKANPYDPEKAKALLAEAGYPDGLTVKMKTIESKTYSKPTEIIQEQLRKIGINVEIEIMERGAWFADVLASGNYEMTFWAIPITVIDPDFATYSAFHSSMAGGSGNFTEVAIPKLDKLLEAGRVSQSAEERKTIYRDVCQIIKDESVLIPLFTGRRCIAANKGLQNVKADPVLKYYVYEYSWE